MGILEWKWIYSREQLETTERLKSPISQFNDTVRLDLHRDYVNLSVSKPNGFLLRKFKERINEPWIHWCIIKLNPELLYNSEYLFSVTNAASKAVKKKYPLGSDKKSFDKLFLNSLTIATSRSTRTMTRQSLKDNETTDNQAEVLVKEKISVGFIKSICFENAKDEASARAAFRTLKLPIDKFTIDENIFNYS